MAEQQDSETRHYSLPSRTNATEESPFDRLEARIDAFIERYEQLRSECSNCREQLKEKEAHIQKLQEKVQDLQRQKSEVRRRLDGLIDKLSRFS